MMCKCGNIARYVHPLDDNVLECLGCSDKTIKRMKADYKSAKLERRVDDDVVQVANVKLVKSVGDFEMLVENLLRGDGSFSERCQLMYNYLQTKQYGGSEMCEPLAV